MGSFEAKMLKLRYDTTVDANCERSIMQAARARHDDKNDEAYKQHLGIVNMQNCPKETEDTGDRRSRATTLTRRESWSIIDHDSRESGQLCTHAPFASMK